jgi:Ca2+-binding RTX toxin-like protein
MKRRWIVLFLVLAGSLTLTASNLKADFVQCISGWVCNGTDSSDIINGTLDSNEIHGMDGNDTIFAGDNPSDPCPPSVMNKEPVGGMMFGVTRCPQGVFRSFTPSTNHEIIFGGPGNDFISGGPGAESIFGEEGNDILLANTDVPTFGQNVNGGPGNDTIYVLAGDVSACMIILGQGGLDIVNLIGFGPYSASQPFGIDGLVLGWIHVIDPIGGGDIFIRVDGGNDSEVEVINGLLSPNVTYIPGEPVPPASNPCIIFDVT